MTVDLLRRVAERTVQYPFRVWGFGEGHALLGLLAAASLLDRPDLADVVRARVEPSLDADPGPEDHLIAVDVLLHLRQFYPGLDVKPAVDRFTASVTSAARPVPGRPRVHRPDLAGLGRLIWVDCMHTDAVLGRVDLVEEPAAVLQDSTGLFHHGYDVYEGKANGVHWGRGQGWALWGLVTVLARAREDGAVPGAGRGDAAPHGRGDAAPHGRDGAAPHGRDGPALRGRLDALVDALTEYETEGRWRTIVDSPDAPVEPSVSALVAAGLLYGLQAGVVAPSAAGLADRALAYASSAARAADGALVVSEATPVGSPVTYLSRRSGVFPWGQGPLLVALALAAGHSLKAGVA